MNLTVSHLVWVIVVPFVVLIVFWKYRQKYAHTEIRRECDKKDWAYRVDAKKFKKIKSVCCLCVSP